MLVRLQRGDPGWESAAPGLVATIIKERGLFGHHAPYGPSIRGEDVVGKIAQFPIRVRAVCSRAFPELFHGGGLRATLVECGADGAYQLVNSLLCWGFLRFSATLLDLLGRTGMNIISRLMGIILVAMAVQFMGDGAYDLFVGAQSQAAR